VLSALLIAKVADRSAGRREPRRGSTGGAIDHVGVNLIKLTLPRFTNGDRDGRMEFPFAVLLSSSPRGF